MTQIPQAKRNMPEQIQGCYCLYCLKIAPSWWPRGWGMAHDGFICPECMKGRFK